MLQLRGQKWIIIIVGLLAKLVERYTGIAEVKGSNPIQAWIIFQAFFSHA